MTPDELRALAYALDDEDFEFRDSPMQVRRKWADYLRAQADAQPVAWMHPDGRVVPAATIDAAYRDGGAMKSSLRNYTIPLYPPPAPAAPQAEAKREPLDDHEISKLAWQQNLWTDGLIEFSFLAFARAVERAHGISGGSDAE